MYKNIFIERGEQWGQDVVHLWDDALGYRTLPFSDFSYAYKPDKAGKHIGMTGVRLTKTKRFKRDDPTLFESDLSPETRVLTDLYLNEDQVSNGHVVMFFDIEVSMVRGIPKIETTENEITSIAFTDSATGEYIVHVLDKSGIYTDRTNENVSVFFHDTELSLLYSFLDHYETISPTIISGWNSDGFDIPYLYGRIKVLCGENTANRLSPIGKVRYSNFRKRYQIAGVSCLDYMDLYKKFTYTQLPNYRLDTVGRTEIGMGKVEYEGSLDELFATNLDQFIEYNLQDVRILLGLDKKLKLVELVRGICHVGHVPYEDYSFSSKFLEGSIITYLHRKGLIATNKPEGSRELMEQREDSGDEGFAGAYVRPPMPSMYEWVYSLDIQSLYPSVIMSLNISPETKIGKVLNWNVDRHLRGEMQEYMIQGIGEHKHTSISPSAFKAYVEGEGIMVSSNGIMYDANKSGVIPSILDQWFKQRIEFKGLQEKAAKEGDEALEEFYDRRQHIQKIFLNSLYGVLGLPIFRFFDLDNALAVTASGQDIIKRSSRFVSDLYVKKKVPERTQKYLTSYAKVLDEERKKPKSRLTQVEIDELLRSDDHCIYIDTDSLYFSSTPLIPEGADPMEYTITLARAVENRLNAYYDSLTEELFFCKNHRLRIKGEIVARRGIWIAKKRYALDVMYSLEKNKPYTGPPKVKGLDVVRSTFPPAFRRFMEDMMSRILKNAPKSEIDQLVLEFRGSLKSQGYLEVARNTAVKNLSEYSDGTEKINSFRKGTPAHVKAALNYNRLLKHFGVQDQYEQIADGAKVKWVYLTQNPLRVNEVAVTGYKDPQQIIDLITEYIDYNALFESELEQKIQDFYDALGWGMLPTKVNQNFDEWFSFT